MPAVKLDLEIMKSYMLADWEDFAQKGQEFEGTHDKSKRYIFIDNGADILGVAHLDSVNLDNHFNPVTAGGQTKIFTSRVDDRMGAYILLDVLPRHGVKCDVLLTDGEETGQSSASIFEPPDDKQYKWMFQFDRHGTDVVHYQYTDMRQYLEKAGFKSHEISYGQLSDICKLESLKCLGANFGTGYHDEHTHWAYVDPDEALMNIKRFLAFYHQFKTKHLQKKVYTSVKTAPAVQNEYREFQHGYWEYSGGNKHWVPYIKNITKPIDRRKFCAMCKRQLIPSVDPEIHEGICSMCEIHLHNCLSKGCDNTWDDRQENQKGLCKECYQSAIAGVSRATRIRCTKCNTEYWSEEIIKGHTCPDENWEGYMWGG